MRTFRRLTLGAYIACLVNSASSQTPQQCVNESLVNQNIDNDQLLPYVRARFPSVHFSPRTGNPYTGHQNFTYCCVQAVDYYLSKKCLNDAMVHIGERLLTGSQFPCGAQWIGDTSGAPQVQVSYAWASEHCPGWQMSKGNNVNEWTQMLVGFVLPAVVFSFNVPRPRKLRIWEGFFPRNIENERLLAGLLGAVGAGVSVIIDAIIWVMATFAFAGPLILSGLYEAQLDKRVLAFIEESNDHDDLQLALKARMMFSVLCGNLDLHPAWSDTMDLTSYLDELDQEPSQSEETRQPVQKSTTTQAVFGLAQSPQVSSPRHRASLPSRGNINDLRSSGSSSSDPIDIDQVAGLLSDGSHPDTYDSQRHMSNTPHTTNFENVELKQFVENVSNDLASHSTSTAELSYSRLKTIGKVTVRLRAMLACQYSFGTTPGGPVVFFIGSFLYALLQLNEFVGEEDIALALAFGMWWMIVPHVSIISGLLLAGNNPNILEGIVGMRDYRYTVGDDLSLERRNTAISLPKVSIQQRDHLKQTLTDLMEKVYEARYEPAWMWDRGRCKYHWLLVLFADSWEKYSMNDRAKPNTHQRLVRFLGHAVTLSVVDWVFLWLFAFLLLFAPWLFGFLTAYYTPVVGISCRAFTFLVHSSAQTVLLLLWTYHLTWRDEYWVLGRKINHQLHQPIPEQDDELESLRTAFQTLVDLARRDTNAPVSDEYSVKKRGLAVEVLFYGLGSFCVFWSLLASIGGSVMQVIGLYRTNLCQMTVAYWVPPRRASTWLLHSSNTSQEISEAKRHWMVIGALSVVFLSVVCYIGWYYQKVLRATFKRAAGQLDGLTVRQRTYEKYLTRSRNTGSTGQCL